MKQNQILIGIDQEGEKVVDSTETQKQIDIVRGLECAFISDKGDKIEWDDVDCKTEPRSLLQAILNDRKKRVDQNTLMADRPLFAVVTEENGKAVRFEYYEGHDSLDLTYDFRSADLQGKDLKRYLEEDPHAYEPITNLTSIPPEIIKELLKKLHEKE